MAKLSTAEITEPTGNPAAVVWDREQLTDAGAALGTADYMSPEQVLGKALDARSDLFSLGGVLYEMAVGVRPFSGTSSIEIFDAILHQAPVTPRRLNGSLPEALERLIVRCLQRDRELRYQSAAEIRADLERLKRKQDLLRRFRRARPLLVLAAGVICCGVASYLLLRPLAPPRVSGYVQISNDGQGKGGPFGGIALDGAHLYLAEGSIAATAIARISTAGGETVHLLTAFGLPEVQDLSQTRSELLVTDFSHNLGWPLWILPLTTGPPRRVGQALATGAAWSPDGREIAYIRDRDLYRANSDGINPRKIATLPGGAFSLRWSPDGRRLRFTVGNPVDRVGALSIWEVSADGTGLHPFLPGWNQPPQECCGNWAPDGKYFVFQSTRNGKTEVWATRELRSAFEPLVNSRHTPVRLTSGQLNSLAPVFSPDGKKLYVIGQQLRGEVVRYDLNARPWLSYFSGISAEFLDFSRDGKWVAYCDFPEGALWRSKVDGSERLRLTGPPMQVMHVRWSPDGTKIAFRGVQPGPPSRVYVVSASGGPAEPVLPDGHYQEQPSWSPDGSSLLISYVHWLDTTPQGVSLIHLKTREVEKLPESKGMWEAEWSPDGRYVAARTLASHAILLFDFETKRWTELAKSDVAWLSWSKNGEFVYFKRPGSQAAIMRVSIKTRKVEEMVSLVNIKSTGFSGGLWIGLTPDNSPLLLRDTGTQEIYALDWQAQ